MDIEQPATFRWTAPTTRTDGAPISGELSYIITVGDRQYSTVETSFRIDFQAEGFEPGAYVFEIRSQEDFGGVGRVSAPVSLPFTLELIAPPNPPTGLALSNG